MYCTVCKERKVRPGATVCDNHATDSSGFCIVSSCKKPLALKKNYKYSYRYDQSFCKHHADKFTRQDIAYYKFMAQF